LASPAEVSVEFIDALGRIVARASYGVLTAGDHRFPLPEMRAAGLFAIRTLVNGSPLIARAVVER
jgi:hypothetical protein